MPAMQPTGSKLKRNLLLALAVAAIAAGATVTIVRSGASHHRRNAAFIRAHLRHGHHGLRWTKASGPGGLFE